MAPRKIEPLFGTPGDDPGSIGFIQTLISKVDGVVRWARMQDHKSEHYESILASLEGATVEMMASLESIARILITAEITTPEEITRFREEYKDAHAAYRLSKMEETAKRAEPESKIWTPKT